MCQVVTHTPAQLQITMCTQTAPTLRVTEPDIFPLILIWLSERSEANLRKFQRKAAGGVGKIRRKKEGWEVVVVVVGEGNLKKVEKTWKENENNREAWHNWKKEKVIQMLLGSWHLYIPEDLEKKTTVGAYKLCSFFLDCIYHLGD